MVRYAHATLSTSPVKFPGLVDHNLRHAGHSDTSPSTAFSIPNKDKRSSPGDTRSSPADKRSSPGDKPAYGHSSGDRGSRPSTAELVRGLAILARYSCGQQNGARAIPTRSGKRQRFPGIFKDR